MGIRRQFSSLSGGPGSSVARQQRAIGATKSASPDPEQFLRSADENGNSQNPANCAFDISAKLEAYKLRCRALESENGRLMANQGRIISDSNRRLEGHLDEIRVLREQMEAQRRTNGELLRWAQSMERECARAKDLAREWQKFSQYSNRLMQREMRLLQKRAEQAEANSAQLGAENLELKRLCLYLDEQRQSMWGEASRLENHKGQQHQKAGADSKTWRSAEEAEECCSEDAGCCAGSSSPSSSHSENSLGNDDLAVGGDTRTPIQVDREQEEILRSICSELTGNNVESQMRVTAAAAPLHIQPPRILTNLTQELLTSDKKGLNSSLLSNSTFSNSSFGTTAQYGSSFCSSNDSDDTAVLVLDEEEFSSGPGGASALHNQSLEVRELGTISEEEDSELSESTTRERLARLEELSRELAVDEAHRTRENGAKPVGEVGEVVKRRQGTFVNSPSASLQAESGSMLMSMALENQQQQRDNFAGGKTPETQSNRNSSASTGSASSSGAFSGTSRGTLECCEKEDDDLPPEMPLISVAKDCTCIFPGGIQRPSSSMGVRFSSNPTSLASQRQQSSTLPRPGGPNFPLSVFGERNGKCSGRPSSVFVPTSRPTDPPEYTFLNNRMSPRPVRTVKVMSGGGKKSESELGQMTMVQRTTATPLPVRIRVRPPPTVLQQNGGHQTQQRTIAEEQQTARNPGKEHLVDYSFNFNNSIPSVSKDNRMSELTAL